MRPGDCPYLHGCPDTRLLQPLLGPPPWSLGESISWLVRRSSFGRFHTFALGLYHASYTTGSAPAPTMPGRAPPSLGTCGLFDRDRRFAAFGDEDLGDARISPPCPLTEFCDPLSAWSMLPPVR